MSIEEGDSIKEEVLAMIWDLRFAVDLVFQNLVVAGDLSFGLVMDLVACENILTS